MPMISLRQILMDARERGYAVGCFNVINQDMVRGVIQAAEEEKSPVILSFAEGHFIYNPLEKFAPILVKEANEAKVPVAMILDHGKNFSNIIKAMHLGFNAVMFDGSELSYEDNVNQTSLIVKVARELGVSVEAELGHVTRPESGNEGMGEDDSAVDDTSLYTDPGMVKEFVGLTGVDALAVAFGTAHGLYLKEPKLDLERLNKINKIIDIPLVMHGGSGLSDKDFRNSIENGISKINYYTGMALDVANRIKEKLNEIDGNVFYHQIQLWTIEAVKIHVQGVMKLFGSSNRA
jgi:fructose-bisphosphate aldolase class II